ncbi:MAG: NAD(P)H-hydrate dehydratase [Thermodesulfobacteriota bacterium]
MYLVTAEEMRRFDAVAISEYGIPGAVLMENAGRTTYQILKDHMGGDVSGLKVAVVAGPGNNGGDGYVIARYLINADAEVVTFLLSPRDKVRGDALINLQVLEKMTSQVVEVTDEDQLADAVSWWHEADVIVDAMLGTGLESEVRSPYLEAVRGMNESRALRVAVDLPSGLHADSGKIMAAAVRADLTVTYGFMKIGMAVHPGLDHCGRVETVDISIPTAAVRKNPPLCTLYDTPDLHAYRRLRRDPEAHKGSFGHLLVVGGSPGKTGAPAMAAMAASRVGAGLVTVGVPASLNGILEIKLTEEMTEPLPETVTSCLGAVSADRILELAQGKSCMVLGPGLSAGDGAGGMVRKVVDTYDGWIVIDADGLNALGEDLEWLRSARARVVLTPHPGEMGRLTGKSSRQVQEERIAVASKTAAEFGVWVILKGARTLTAFPDGRLVINPTGNPWMASGGQGDVLSGLLGGLLVQGLPPDAALPLGVYLHGLAADTIVNRTGPAPVVATDILRELPEVLNSIA